MIRSRIILLLMLAGGTGAVGCASLFWPMVVTLSSDVRCLRCGVAEGLFRVDYDGHTRAITPNPNAGHWQRSDELAFSLTGFVFESYLKPNYAWRYFKIHVPFWIPAVLLAAYPGLVSVRRWRRRKRGLCLKCGYDLRGSPGPRCPECGEAI